MELELQLTLASGAAADERWHLRKVGTRFWALGEFTTVISEGGGHSGFVKVVRDQTAEHDDRLALREAEGGVAATHGGVQIETATMADLRPAFVDAPQLENALNLCINARDAMPNGGKITSKQQTAGSIDKIHVNTTCLKDSTCPCAFRIRALA